MSEPAKSTWAVEHADNHGVRLSMAMSATPFTMPSADELLSGLWDLVASLYRQVGFLGDPRAALLTEVFGMDWPSDHEQYSEGKP